MENVNSKITYHQEGDYLIPNLTVPNDENENLYMAARNLGNVLVLMVDEINCYDIVNADVMVCDEEAVKKIEEAIK